MNLPKAFTAPISEQNTIPYKTLQAPMAHDFLPSLLSCFSNPHTTLGTQPDWGPTWSTPTDTA